MRILWTNQLWAIIESLVSNSKELRAEKMTDRRGVVKRSGAVGGSALLAGGAVGSAVLLSMFASPAGATTTFTVDTNADGVANASDCVTPVANSCSLRDALAAATTDGDIIVFAAALSGQTISLSQGNLMVDAGITITGLGSANLTVDAGGNSRVFYISSAANGAEVLMSGLSVINGDAGSAYGGGLYDGHDSDLTLTDVSITGCVADYGGGIYVGRNNGTVKIIDSTISDNYATETGGGLYTDGEGDLIITNSTFDSNSSGSGGGAGELGNSGNITITDSTFSNNTAYGQGGALYIESGSSVDVSISGSTFSDNAANSDGGGAISAFNSGSFTVTSSTFSGNQTTDWGGALYLGTEAQVVTVTDSLFTGNSSLYGGALDFDGTGQVVTINNSTIVDNTADVAGGGIWNESGGSLTINMSTITENSSADGGGVFFYDSGQNPQAEVTITGTILAGNTGTAGAANDLGTYDDATSPVATISDSILGAVEAGITVTASNNIDATAPGFVLGLGALADNGGATKTMALLTGSPAIDAGPATVPTFTGNGFDQRGTPYVRVYNGQSDIGAFEFQPDSTPSTTTTTTAVATDDAVVPAFTG